MNTCSRKNTWNTSASLKNFTKMETDITMSTSSMDEEKISRMQDTMTSSKFIPISKSRTSQPVGTTIAKRTRISLKILPTPNKKNSIYLIQQEGLTTKIISDNVWRTEFSQHTQLSLGTIPTQWIPQLMNKMKYSAQYPMNSTGSSHRSQTRQRSLLDLQELARLSMQREKPQSHASSYHTWMISRPSNQDTTNQYSSMICASPICQSPDKSTWLTYLNQDPFMSATEQSRFLQESKNGSPATGFHLKTILQSPEE